MSRFNFILVFLVAFQAVLAQKDNCNKVAQLTDQQYKEHIAEKVTIIDQLLDENVEKAIVEINHTLSGCLRTSDENNRGFLICKKAMAYAFMGKTDLAKKTLKVADACKQKCTAPNFVGYHMATTDYFIESTSGSEAAIDRTLKDCIHYATLLGDTVKLAYSYANRASNLVVRSRFVPALDLTLRSLELMKNKDRPDFMFGSYVNLAQIYNSLQNPTKALEITEKALKITGENTGTNAPEMYNCRGYAYLELKKIASAQAAFQTSRHLNENLKSPKGLAYSFHGLGDSYFAEKKFGDAIQFYSKALALEVEHQLRKEMVQTYLGLGNCYLETNQFQRAGDYYEKADRYKDSIILQDELFLIPAAKIKLYLKEQRPVLYDTYVSCEKARDSIFAQKEIRFNLDLLEKYEADRLFSQNSQLISDQAVALNTISDQRNYLTLGGIGIGLVGLLSLLFYRQKQKQKKLTVEVSHQRDQIALLNRELNHRVKNNLAFMSSLLEMQGRRSQSEEAKQVLRDSESRLRTLSLVHTQLVSNNENKTINLKTYLESILSHLQNIFEIPGKTLDIHANLVDHPIDAEAAMRIGLILNELVTNSAKHAFDDVASPLIQIRTKVQAGKLELSYRDNGPGTQYFTFPDQAAVGSTTSMGQKLLELLLRQLGGTPVVADGAFVVELAV